MSTNGNLNKARSNKNDEFYTRYEDIGTKLCYKRCFRRVFVKWKETC